MIDIPTPRLLVPKKQAVLIRAFEKTVIRPDTGCLIYEGSHSGNGRGGGYPRASYLNCTVGLHIFGFECYHGRPVKAGHHLDHLCENRPCWNPHHLEEVKQSVNEKRKHRRRKHAPQTYPQDWIQNQFAYSPGQAIKELTHVE